MLNFELYFLWIFTNLFVPIPHKVIQPAIHPSLLPHAQKGSRAGTRATNMDEGIKDPPEPLIPLIEEETLSVKSYHSILI
jgi:hypothetical protein